MEDNSKANAKILFIYEDIIFFFIYNMRITNLGKFPNLSVCDMSIFPLKIKIAVELQIHSRNFKTRWQEKNLEYSQIDKTLQALRY